MIPPFALPDHLEPVEHDTQGRTLRTLDLLRNRTVALKWASTRVGVQGLKREWTLLSLLSSRFVPEPIDFLVLDAQSALLTTGWIEGESLDLFLRGADAAGQVACVMDALAGLDHLHRAGLCHRDIKAHNLLVTTGPSGPRARWLDLEHAVTPGSLDSGAMYIAAPPQGLERGGEVFNPRDDIGSFCALLREALPRVPGGPAVDVLSAFADLAATVFYLDEMPHARAAWAVLREMFQAARLPVPADCSALGHPNWLPSSAALKWWNSQMRTWELARDTRLLRVHGRAGAGKRHFLGRMAAILAKDGARVTNLLGTRSPDLRYLQAQLQKAPSAASFCDAWRVVLIDEAVDLDGISGWPHLPGAPLLLVVVADSDSPSRSTPQVPSGATCVDWSFEGFSARDWYRWIRASA